MGWLKARNEPERLVPQLRQPSADEVQTCLDLIRSNRFAGPKEQLDPCEMNVMTRGDDQLFVVQFEDPKTLAEGTIYHEWAVYIPSSGAPKVTCGRAQIRNGGPDTLPPEGWDD
jgi:hypothetical protein